MPLRSRLSLPNPLLVGSLGVFLLVCLDTCMKAALASLPVGQSVFMRYAAALPFAALAWALRARRSGRRLGDFSLALASLRGLLMAASGMLFFYAVQVMPLAQVIAITFVAPFAVALIARLFLGEAITAKLLIGMAISFAGLLVVLGGQLTARQGSALAWGAAAALLSTVTYAASNVMTRHQAAVAPVEWVVFVPTVATSMVLVPLAAQDWQPMSGGHAMLFALCGLFGTTGQLLLAWAYGRATAARVAVLDYTSFAWAGLLALAIFSEVPSFATVAGAAVIIAGCFVALWQPISGPKLAASPESTPP